MLTQEQVDKALSNTGYDDNVIDKFKASRPNLDYIDSADVASDIHKFFKALIDVHVQQMTRRQLSTIVGAVTHAALRTAAVDYTLDETVATESGRIARAVLGISGARHDNDHEYYALCDAIVRRAANKIKTIIGNWLLEN